MTPAIFPMIAGEAINAFHAIAYNPSDSKWYRSHILAPPFRIEGITLTDLAPNEEGYALYEGSFNWTPAPTASYGRNNNIVLCNLSTSKLETEQVGDFFTVATHIYVGRIITDSAVVDNTAMVLIDRDVRSFPFTDITPITRTITQNTAFFDTLVDGQLRDLYACVRIPCGILNPGQTVYASLTPMLLRVVVNWTSPAITGNWVDSLHWHLERPGAVYDSASGNSIKGDIPSGGTSTTPAPATAYMKKGKTFQIPIDGTGANFIASGCELWIRLRRDGGHASDTMAGTVLVSSIDLFC